MKSKQTKVIYTTEELNAMSVPQLNKLRGKAEELNALALIAKIDSVIENRPKRKGGKVARKHVSVIQQINQELVRVQIALSEKFDMSKESANTAHPHNLIGKNGGGKAGGSAMGKNKKNIVDDYISYRNGDNTVWFGIVMAIDADLPHLELTINGEVKQYPLGQFDDAAAQYAVHIARIAPARSA